MIPNTAFGATFFNWLLTSSFQGAIFASLIGAVIAFCSHVLRRPLPPGLRYGLWLMLAVRLILPAAPSSSFSIYNWFPNVAVRRPAPVIVPAPIALLPRAMPSSAALDKDWIEQYVADIASVPPLSATSDLQSGLVDRDPSAAIPPPSPSHLALSTWIASGWLAVALFLFNSALVRSRRLAARLRNCHATCDPATLALVDSCRAAMNIRTPVAVHEIGGLRSPALYGIARPQLLLPIGALDSLSKLQLRHVIMHELAHAKRRDLALNWLLTAIQALHWFNPVVWLAFHQLRADRELLCDAMVLRGMSPDDYRSYGETIIEMLARNARPKYAPHLAGFLESKSQIQRRLVMISQYTPRAPRYAAIAPILIAIIACATLTNARPTQGTQNPPTAVQAAGATSETHIVESRVPILGRLPLIGRFFRKTAVTKTDAVNPSPENPPVAVAPAPMPANTGPGAAQQIPAAANPSPKANAAKAKAELDLTRERIDKLQEYYGTTQVPHPAKTDLSERDKVILDQARAKLARTRALSAQGLLPAEQSRQAESDYAIKAAEANGDTTQALKLRLEAAHSKYARAKELGDRGVVPQEEVRAAELRYKVAQARLAAAGSKGDPLAESKLQLEAAMDDLQRKKLLYEKGVISREEEQKAEDAAGDLKLKLDQNQAKSELRNDPSDMKAKKLLDSSSAALERAAAQKQTGTLNQAEIRAAENKIRTAQMNLRGAQTKLDADPGNANAQDQLKKARVELGRAAQALDLAKSKINQLNPPVAEPPGIGTRQGAKLYFNSLDGNSPSSVNSPFHKIGPDANREQLQKVQSALASTLAKIDQLQGKGGTVSKDEMSDLKAQLQSIQQNLKDLSPGAEPTQNSMVYRVGPGDIIHAEVRKDPTISLDYRVTDDGNIIVAAIGPVQVAGLTTDEISKKLLALWGESIRFDQRELDKEVRVAVREFHSKVSAPSPMVAPNPVAPTERMSNLVIPPPVTTAAPTLNNGRYSQDIDEFRSAFEPRTSIPTPSITIKGTTVIPHHSMPAPAVSRVPNPSRGGFIPSDAEGLTTSSLTGW